MSISPLRYACDMSIDHRCQSSMAARANTVLTVGMWTMGVNTSRYLNPGHWLYPFATSLALCLSIVLSALYLIRNTHLDPITLQFSGLGTRSHVLVSAWLFILSLVALSQFRASGRVTATA